MPYLSTRSQPRPRLLFVTDVTPYPLDRGQRIRVEHLLAACNRAFDVTLVTPRPDDPADAERVTHRCQRTVWIGDTLAGKTGGWPRRAALCGRTALSMAGLPRISNVARFLPIVAAIEETDPASFDLIWAERPHIAKLVARFRDKTIVDLDDLDHRKMARRFQVVGGARERALLAYRFTYYRHLEVRWASSFLASVVCSEEDRRYLRSHGCDSAVVVPNGPALPVANDLPWRGPQEPLEPGATAPPARLVFLGNMSFEPNVDAIDYFVAEIAPRLSGGATLDVIGPNVSESLQRRFGSAVRFRGFVDDLPRALSAYDMMVVPLRIGGGTKVKVLDAMASGLPIVTTAVGAEGLGLRHDVSAWIADTPSALSEGIAHLRRRPDVAYRLATTARTWVAERYSWPAIEADLARWLLGARGAKASPALLPRMRPYLPRDRPA